MADGASRQRGWLAITLVMSAVVLIVTAPKWLYVGDAVVMRCGTERLIEAGRLDVAAELGATYGAEGQYFYRTERGEYFSKYGWFNSLLYAPPLLVERMVRGEFPPRSAAKSDNRLRTSLLNYYNVLLALALAYYLYTAANFYCDDPRVSAAFVLLVFFSTFLWNYLRAHTVEIFQLIFFTACFVHFVRAMRCGDEDNETEKSPPIRDEVLGWVFLTLLCWEKSVYVVLLPLALVWRQMAGQHARRLLVGVAAVFATGLVIALGNWRCFDSVWESGYGQWERESQLFHWDVYVGALGFFVDPRKSVPLHFPLIAIALLFSPLWVRRFGGEAVFPLSCLAVMWFVSSAFVNWRGDWCYGPRYLAFALPVVSLPVLFLGRLDVRRTLGPLRGVLLGAVVLVSLWSLRNQFYVNSLEFFAPFRAEEILVGPNPDAPQGPFAAPHWEVNRQLLQALRDGETKLDPQSHGREARIERLRQVTALNYAWLQ